VVVTDDASTAPYLLFTDGDRFLPADHLRVHLEERRPGRIGAGDCLRLDREASQRVDLDAVRSGSFGQGPPATPRTREAPRKGVACPPVRAAARAEKAEALGQQHRRLAG
jgi:hypothetical protein